MSVSAQTSTPPPPEKTHLEKATSIIAVAVGTLTVLSFTLGWCFKIDDKTNHYDYLFQQSATENINRDARIKSLEDDNRKTQIALSRIETKIDWIMSSIRVKFTSEKGDQ